MIEARLSGLFGVALTACLTRYVAAKGKGNVVCEVTLPKTSTADVTTRAETCSKACQQQGPQALVASRAKQPSTNAPSGSYLASLFARHGCKNGKEEIAIAGLNPCGTSGQLVFCDASAEKDLFSGGCTRATAHAAGIDFCCPSSPD
jgi:hypothetical protein